MGVLLKYLEEGDQFLFNYENLFCLPFPTTYLSATQQYLFRRDTKCMFYSIVVITKINLTHTLL